MRQFRGFPPGKARMIKVPSEVFSDLLPMIDDLGELKLTLFAMWALQQKDRDSYRYLRPEDFTHPAVVAMHGMKGELIDAALKRCVERGTLLRAEVILGRDTETLYFANSQSGRKAVEQIKAGEWLPGDNENPVQVLPERPNAYKLYEDNVGSLTPMIVEDLKDAESEYGAEWLSEAIQLSVQYEKRNMRYIRAILDRWKQEGKRDEKSERRSQGNEQRSLSGKYSDFFER